jgi:signal transduction histidine kinase
LDFKNDEKILIEKNGLAQTIGNFVQNAGQAILERKRTDASFFGGVVTISSFLEGNKIFLCIADDGAGIKDNIKGELFKFGFTTKLEGSGFGLHSCYNFIKGNEGEMSITSAGENLGAVVKIGFNLTPQVV